MRKYVRRGVERPNAFKAYSFEDLKTIYELRGTGHSIKQIADEIGRSTSSITNIVSYLKSLLKFPTWKDATTRLATSRLSQNSVEAYHQLYEYIKSGPVQLPKVLSSNGEAYAKDLEGAIEDLDQTLEAVKAKIEHVIVLAVDQRTADYKKEKEAELLSLQTVVEASKQNNLASMLKKRLMGR